MNEGDDAGKLRSELAAVRDELATERAAREQLAREVGQQRTLVDGTLKLVGLGLQDQGMIRRRLGDRVNDEKELNDFLKRAGYPGGESPGGSLDRAAQVPPDDAPGPPGIPSPRPSA